MSSLLKRAYGGRHSAVKIVAAAVGANERAVKNWFDGKNGPNGENLLLLVRHAKAMKELWCLAASDPEAPAATLVDRNARRWTIEPQLRDTLVSAFAVALLTLLGAVGESLGMDRQLKSNTSKTRTHSLSGKAACSTT